MTNLNFTQFVNRDVKILCSLARRCSVYFSNFLYMSANLRTSRRGSREKKQTNVWKIRKMASKTVIRPIERAKAQIDTNLSKFTDDLDGDTEVSVW